MFPATLALYDEKLQSVEEEARQMRVWYDTTIARIDEELAYKRRMVERLDDLYRQIDTVKNTPFCSRRIRLLKSTQEAPLATESTDTAALTTTQPMRAPSAGPPVRPPARPPAHPQSRKRKHRFRALCQKMRIRLPKQGTYYHQNTSGALGDSDDEACYNASDCKTLREHKQFSKRVRTMMNTNEEAPSTASTPSVPDTTVSAGPTGPTTPSTASAATTPVDAPVPPVQSVPETLMPPPPPPPPPLVTDPTAPSGNEFAILHNLPERTYEDAGVKTSGFIIVGKTQGRRRLFRKGVSRRLLSLPGSATHDNDGNESFQSAFYRSKYHMSTGHHPYNRYSAYRFNKTWNGMHRSIAKVDPYEMVESMKHYTFEKLIREAMQLATEETGLDVSTAVVATTDTTDPTATDTPSHPADNEFDVLLRDNNEIARCSLNVVEVVRFELRRMLTIKQKEIAETRGDVLGKIAQLQTTVEMLRRDSAAHSKRDAKSEFIIDSIKFTQAHDLILKEFRANREDLYRQLEGPHRVYPDKRCVEFRQHLDAIIKQCEYRLNTLNIKFMLQFMPTRLTTDERAVFSSYPTMLDPMCIDTKPDEFLRIGVRSEHVCARCLTGTYHQSADAWMYVCDRCGHQQSRQIDNYNYEDLSFDYTKPGSSSYVRLNHYMERLSNLFGENTKMVRAEAMAAIELHIQRNEAGEMATGGGGESDDDDNATVSTEHTISTMCTVDTACTTTTANTATTATTSQPHRRLSEFRRSINNITMKGILEYLQKTNKSLSLNDYYNNATQLAMHFNPSFRPPQLTHTRKMAIRQSFLDIDHAYNQRNFTHRQNIFPFTFLSHKIFERLGYFDYLPLIDQLKGRDLLIQHEIDWSVVATRLKWDKNPIVGNLLVSKD